MQSPIYSTERGDYGRKHWPERAIEASVHRTGTRTLRNASGETVTEPTFSTFATFSDTLTEFEILSGVGLDTAKFHAQCVTGSFLK